MFINLDVCPSTSDQINVPSTLIDNHAWNSVIVNFWMKSLMDLTFKTIHIQEGDYLAVPLECSG